MSSGLAAKHKGGGGEIGNIINSLDASFLAEIYLEIFILLMYYTCHVSVIH